MKKFSADRCTTQSVISIKKIIKIKNMISVFVAYIKHTGLSVKRSNLD